MANDMKIVRERVWRGRLAGWQASGLSQAAFCRREQLTENDFSWWKRELARRDRQASETVPAFVPVQLPSARAPGGMFELEMRGGRVLRFDSGIDPAKLDAVVRVLEAVGLTPEAGLKPGAGPC